MSLKILEKMRAYEPQCTSPRPPVCCCSQWSCTNEPLTNYTGQWQYKDFSFCQVTPSSFINKCDYKSHLLCLITRLLSKTLQLIIKLFSFFVKKYDEKMASGFVCYFCFVFFLQKYRKRWTCTCFSSTTFCFWRESKKHLERLFA